MKGGGWGRRRARCGEQQRTHNSVCSCELPPSRSGSREVGSTRRGRPGPPGSFERPGPPPRPPARRGGHDRGPGSVPTPTDSSRRRTLGRRRVHQAQDERAHEHVRADHAGGDGPQRRAGRAKRAGDAARELDHADEADQTIPAAMRTVRPATREPRARAQRRGRARARRPPRRPRRARAGGGGRRPRPRPPGRARGGRRGGGGAAAAPPRMVVSHGLRAALSIQDALKAAEHATRRARRDGTGGTMGEPPAPHGLVAAPPRDWPRAHPAPPPRPRRAAGVLGVTYRTRPEPDCANGFATCVSLLLAAGADPNIKSKHGEYTPLVGACLSGDAECCRLLLQAGADMFQVADDGRMTPFIAALAQVRARERTFPLRRERSLSDAVHRGARAAPPRARARRRGGRARGRARRAAARPLLDGGGAPAALRGARRPRPARAAAAATRHARGAAHAAAPAAALAARRERAPARVL